MPPKIVRDAQVRADTLLGGLKKSAVAFYKGKVGKLLHDPTRDGWATIEHADGSEEKKAKVSEMKLAGQDEWEDAKRKAHGFDDKNWVWGTFVQTTTTTLETVIGAPKPRKVKAGMVGKIKDTPNRDGDVKLEWPDGKITGYISILTLRRVTEDEWIAAHADTGLDVTTQSQLSRNAAKGIAPCRKQLRGAKPPEGDDGPMLLTQESDMHVAFEWLDNTHEGSLSRTKSRDWLRAMGYCIHDDELDAMLDVHGPSRGPSRGGIVKNRTKWSFTMLQGICFDNQDRHNSSIEELSKALQILAGTNNGNGRIPKDKLMEITVQEGDITGTNLEEVLESIGMIGSQGLVCDKLAAKLIDRICNPPSVLRAAEDSD